MFCSATSPINLFNSNSCKTPLIIRRGFSFPRLPAQIIRLYTDELSPNNEETSPYNEELSPCKEEMSLCKEETGPCNEEMSPCKEETGPCKEETGSCNEEMSPCKEEMSQCNEETGSCNEESPPCNGLFAVIRVLTNHLFRHARTIQRCFAVSYRHTTIYYLPVKFIVYGK